MGRDRPSQEIQAADPGLRLWLVLALLLANLASLIPPSPGP